MANATNCHFVPLSDYDWSFNRKGPLPWNPTVWGIIAAFSALAIWSTIELTAHIFFTFKRYKGVYFWSILLTTWGVTLHAIGWLLKNFAPHVNWIFSTVVAEVGWVGMVSGFSVVLWSRLHLVCRNETITRWVLVMIIIDAFLFHTLTVVTQFGLSSGHAHAKWASIMAPMERVQVTAFTIQETIISGLYMWSTWLVLKGRVNVSTQTWKVMFLLFTVQVIVILIDVVIITLDYVEFFTLKAIIHSFVYAVKLKLEFIVLNQLVNLAKNGLTPKGLATISDSDVSERNYKSSGASSPIPTPTTVRPPVTSEKKNWFSKTKPMPTAAPMQPSLQQPHIYNPHTYQPATATIISDPITSTIVNTLDIQPNAFEPRRREDSDVTLRADSAVSLKKIEPPPRWHNSGNDSDGGDTDLSELERQYLGRGSGRGRAKASAV